MSLAKIRIAARLLAVATLAALTAGCFQPMYAEHSDGTPGLREKLQGVELPPVDKPNASREARIGVAIRNALIVISTSSLWVVSAYRFSRRYQSRNNGIKNLCARGPPAIGGTPRIC